jgi:hypothetical protein
MPEPDYAVVDILCDEDKLDALLEIPNLEVQVNIMRTPDPAVVRLSALADEDAQTAARTLGCTVTIVTSADDFRQQLDDAYTGLAQDPGPADEPGDS